MADGGYWNQTMITRGIEVLIPTQRPSDRPRAAVISQTGVEADRIDRLLGTPEGQARYRQRAAMVDTSHTYG